MITKEQFEDYKKRLKEEIKKIMYGKIDWFEVFKDAYEGRKTAWFELGHINEWRNATDEVLFAVWKQLGKEIDNISIHSPKFIEFPRCIGKSKLIEPQEDHDSYVQGLQDGIQAERDGVTWNETQGERA